jgi:hypothetical protein
MASAKADESRVTGAENAASNIISGISSRGRPMNSADSEKLLKNYQRDGFVLVKGVFSATEITQIRSIVGGMDQRLGDILSHDSLRPFLLDDRVLSILRLLLGDRIVYYGDSSIQYEPKVGYRAFHQDSLDDFDDPILTECKTLRIGIYLQDHAKHGGGLKVRRGSHRHVFLGRTNLKRFLWGKPHGPLRQEAFRFGKGINLDSEPGDLVIWNHRTWHSGFAARLKWFPSFCINPRLEKYFPEWMCLPDIRPRAVLFASFGAPSKGLEICIRERAMHFSNKGHWQACRYDSPNIIAECSAKQLELRFDGIMLNRS